MADDALDGLRAGSDAAEECEQQHRNQAICGKGRGSSARHGHASCPRRRAPGSAPRHARTIRRATPHACQHARAVWWSRRVCPITAR
jgi:hypothetical protein